MADRHNQVHPVDAPTKPPSSPTKTSSPPESATKPPPPPQVPPPATYVIQVPKDQIYRVPPPENAKLFEKYSRRSIRRRNRCRWFFFSLTFLVLLLAVAAGVFYLVFRPESPSYSVNAISISGMNLTSSSEVSPVIRVTIGAKNPNDKIGIYYVKGSSVRVYYSDVKLADGVLPAFYQPSNNVTELDTALRGNGIMLTGQTNRDLLTKQNDGSVPLRLKLTAPVKFKVGAVKTWKITVKLSCDVTVDKLTETAKIVHEDCDYGVNIL